MYGTIQFLTIVLSQARIATQDCLCPNIEPRGAVQEGRKGVKLKVPSNLHQCCLQRSPHFVQFGDSKSQSDRKEAACSLQVGRSVVPTATEQ